MSGLAEITAVALHRPSLMSTESEVRGWYRAKAELHSHLAAVVSGPERIHEQSYVLAARQHVIALEEGNADV